MKTDRLIAILSVLLNHEQITAPELAKRVEVSRRTISRDIDALNQAGIPIVTRQGTGGGIRIMDGFRMDRTALTSREIQAILSGLRSLDSVSGSGQYRLLMEKISPGSSGVLPGDQHILIDLASWYRPALTEKIELLHSAIERNRLVLFHYLSPHGESDRAVEPALLIFQWSSWYLWGWCLDRKDYRLFKLNRMDRVRKTEESFECRNDAVPDLSDEKIFPGGIRVRALFDADQKWRLAEEFGPASFTETEDGRLLFEADYTDMDNLVTWLMTFGDKAEVFEPEEAREKITETVQKMAAVYKGYGYGI